MIISARVAKPRKQRRCEVCSRPICDEALRLFGAADSHDKPYAIYLHPTCYEGAEPKVLKALEGKQ